MKIIFSSQSRPPDPNGSGGFPRQQAKLIFRHLLFRAGLIGAGVLLAALTAGSAITIPGGFASWLVVTCLLTGFNFLLKPILILFTLPFVLLTFGFGIWLINALLFLFAGAVVPGFEVSSFWAALWGSLVVSLSSLFIQFFLSEGPPPPDQKPGEGPPPGGVRRYRPSGRKDDVIDI